MIQILSLNGKMLKQLDVKAGDKTASVDISDLDASLYIFRVIEDNEIQVGKLIKE